MQCPPTPTRRPRTRRRPERPRSTVLLYLHSWSGPGAAPRDGGAVGLAINDSWGGGKSWPWSSRVGRCSLCT
ncbi:hypothetical protein BDZ91DRAFT_714380 [Kalaharituber pfeilii]|nr:hypothetical protein BDZ91DRAFT_714380 [Kalaharituber pfeilii]